jgi:predicted ATPase
LAAFLYNLKKNHLSVYEEIRDTVRLVAPFFGDFLLRPYFQNPNQIQLEWTQKDSDIPFHGSQLSDGTLRFICLVAALLQPSPPKTLLLDEPELGLHPYALTILSTLIYAAARKSQLIVSTQSADLLSCFEPHQVIVVERQGNESKFKRLDKAALQIWLDDEYSLGDLWRKNILGGRP